MDPQHQKDVYSVTTNNTPPPNCLLILPLFYKFFLRQLALKQGNKITNNILIFSFFFSGSSVALFWIVCNSMLEQQKSTQLLIEIESDL